MEVIYIVLPIAILMAGGFLAAFLWSVHRGQYDELDTPPYRAMFDDDEAATGRKKPQRHGGTEGNSPKKAIRRSRSDSRAEL